MACTPQVFRCRARGAYRLSIRPSLIFQLQLFVILFPEVLVEAVVKAHVLNKHNNPAFRNYEALKDLLPGAFYPKSVLREAIPFFAIVRAYCLRLPRSAAFETLLPFFRGCFVGLAVRPRDLNEVPLLGMPKVTKVTGRNDLSPAKLQEYDVCAALLLAWLLFVVPKSFTLLQEKINKLISQPSAPSDGEDGAIHVEELFHYLWTGPQAKAYIPPPKSSGGDGLLVTASFECLLVDLRTRGDLTVQGAASTDTTAMVQAAIAWQSKSGQRIDQQLLAQEFRKQPTLDYAVSPNRFQCLVLSGHGEVHLPDAQQIRGSDGRRTCSMFPGVRLTFVTLVFAYRYPPGASWQYRFPAAEKQPYSEKPRAKRPLVPFVVPDRCEIVVLSGTGVAHHLIGPSLLKVIAKEKDPLETEQPAAPKS
jgi:hypothetical protein